jgi:hypothetical protein
MNASMKAECVKKGYPEGTADFNTCIALEQQQAVTSDFRRQYFKGAGIGLAGIGTAVMLSGSDERLKQDITRVGQLPNGLSLYRFHYVGSSQLYVGVLAQEVARVVPTAVFQDPYGYLFVNYSALGTNMATWEDWQRTHRV